MTNPYQPVDAQATNLTHRQNWVFMGAILAAVAVGLGAFGAHGLDGLLSERHSGDPDLLARRLDNWKTAALYQMHHSIGLILVGLISLFRSNKWLTIAGWSFLIGILLFSGLLYVLVLSEVRILGAIVPLGGIAYIVGWVGLALGGCCLSPIQSPSSQTVQIGE